MSTPSSQHSYLLEKPQLDNKERNLFGSQKCLAIVILSGTLLGNTYLQCLVDTMRPLVFEMMSNTVLKTWCFPICSVVGGISVALSALIYYQSGIKWSPLIFTTGVMLSQAVFVLGFSKKDVWVVFAAEILYSIASINLLASVAVLMAFLCSIFKIGLSFGILLTVNLFPTIVQTYYADKWFDGSDRQILTINCIGLGLCGLSVLSGFAFFYFERKYHKLDNTLHSYRSTNYSTNWEESKDAAQKTLGALNNANSLAMAVFLNFNYYMFSTVEVNLKLVCIATCLSVVLTPVFGWIFDKYGKRGAMLIALNLTAAVSYIALRSEANAWLYVFIVLYYAIYQSGFTVLYWSAGVGFTNPSSLAIMFGALISVTSFLKVVLWATHRHLLPVFIGELSHKGIVTFYFVIGLIVTLASVVVYKQDKLSMLSDCVEMRDNGISNKESMDLYRNKIVSTNLSSLGLKMNSSGRSVTTQGKHNESRSGTTPPIEVKA